MNVYFVKTQKKRLLIISSLTALFLEAVGIQLEL